MHTGNWLVEKVDGDYKISIIDWDCAHKSWFLIDLGTVVFGIFAGAKMFDWFFGSSAQETNKAELIK